MIICHNSDCPHIKAETNDCTKSKVEISEHGCSAYKQFKLDRQAEKTGVKLKPCPFCGGKAELIYDFIGDGCYVICKNACVLTDRKKGAKEASDLWNNRRTMVEEQEDTKNENDTI